jgi:hypothetical protein
MKIKIKEVYALNDISQDSQEAGTLHSPKRYSGNGMENKIVDKLHGGSADYVPKTRFNKKELSMGIEDEKEHTDDEEVASEIARDHLMDDPHYYSNMQKKIGKEQMLKIKINERIGPPPAPQRPAPAPAPAPSPAPAPTPTPAPQNPANPPQQTQNNFRTYGDLKAEIKRVIAGKRIEAGAGNATGIAKDFAVASIESIFPGAALAKTAFEFVMSVYKATDDKKSKTWLDRLNVDDKYSKIIDDSIENAFLKDFVTKLMSEPDNKPLPADFNINAELQKYLSEKFAKRTVTLVREDKECGCGTCESCGSKNKIIVRILKEENLEEKKDRCYHLAREKYKVFPSAYASGFMVRCRKGDVAKKKENKELEEGTFDKEKSKGLHGWFQRQGGKGKSKGWVDCNTCRTDAETGRKTCKSCGRQDGEKRNKYPACRPTPSACNKKGTSKKKGSDPVSWKEKKDEN